jgi:hypothetical protein
MKFAPFRAAGIFLVVMLVPTIPFVLEFAQHAPWEVGLLVGPQLISGILFWAGARVARDPHSVKSLAVVVLGTWSFNYATTGLARDLIPDVSYAKQVTMVLQLAFVFMAAWRLPPKVPPPSKVNDAAV